MAYLSHGFLVGASGKRFILCSCSQSTDLTGPILTSSVFINTLTISSNGNYPLAAAFLELTHTKCIINLIKDGRKHKKDINCAFLKGWRGLAVQ